ncbi:peptidylprolyl isomerase [Arenimonas sp.]|uniref:peptidylprolyl isomerase n=1 Tax=Arenimonas sp. TaxID=1872635 RepID=UPI0039E45B1F
MKPIAATALALALSSLLSGAQAEEKPAPPKKPVTMADILAASSAADWRPLDPQNTLYLELASGRVVIELSPGYAPLHVDNIRTLAKQGYYDGLAIVRSQDNYVVQWADPNDDEKTPEKAKPLGGAKAQLPSEYTVPISDATPFTRLRDADGYAPQVGFAQGMPAGRDPKANQTWLTHCYGALGVARGNDPLSGSGTSLYVIIGHAPRQLDRNINVAGRVVQGMEKLSILPRGTGPLGFYEKPEQYVPITSIKLAADVPESERTRIEVLRTDTATWDALVASRRNRKDDWYQVPAGHVELCNVPIPVRPIDAAKPAIAK